MNTTPLVCNKCGGQVPPSNSCRNYDKFTHAYFPPLRAAPEGIDRHLFEINGCEGSPSRRNELLTRFQWTEQFDTSKEFSEWPFEQPRIASPLWDC